MIYIPVDTLLVGLISMLAMARALIVHDARQNAIFIMRFTASMSGETPDIKHFESFGTFWQMYFDVRKWLFNQFYPGVGV